MQTITTVGVDIAKSVFQVHGVDADGNIVIRRQVKRRYVLAFFQKLPPCLVGIEACASSHYWSRELQALGHTVRLMPPAYVKPYVKRHKNDSTDAEAICEAVTRPNMRFVATKAPEQQSCLTLHRQKEYRGRARYVPSMTPLNLSPDELLSTTRTVRKRLDLTRRVEPELLEECLDLAFQAPTGGNLQGWHFVLVADAGRKKALADLYRRPKKENDPATVPPQHQRTMDASAYLAAHLHEVPVLVVPCVEGRTENTPFLQQA